MLVKLIGNFTVVKSLPSQFKLVTGTLDESLSST